MPPSSIWICYMPSYSGPCQASLVFAPSRFPFLSIIFFYIIAYGSKTSPSKRPSNHYNMSSGTLRAQTPILYQKRFKRLLLLPEAGKRRRGRPIKVKTGLRGRPRKFPAKTRECKKIEGCFDTFLHPDSFHKELSLNALPPMFVHMESSEPAPSCKFQITFCIDLLLFILTVA